MLGRAVSACRLFIVLLVMASLSGCASIAAGTTPTRENVTVPLEGALSALVELDIGAGELQVTGGAVELMEADLVYSVRAWRPQVTVERSGDRASVRVDQSDQSLVLPVGRVQNTWTVRLNPEVPMDLKVNLGAGTTRLVLGDLAIRSLDVDMGAGEAELDLTGDWTSDVRASVSGGVGQLTVRLPAEVGVRARVSGGLGSVNAEGLSRDGDDYVNSAYGSSAVTLTVTVEGGIGAVILIVESDRQST